MIEPIGRDMKRMITFEKNKQNWQALMQSNNTREDSNK